MLPVIVNTTAPVGAFMSTAEADSGKRHRQDSGNEDGGCLHELFLDRSTDYDARADAGQMHIIARHEAGLGDVAAEDLIKNYTLRMSRKGVPTRAVYDALKILPRNNRCPFCNYGSVETLDHVLQKNIYPGFSVKPTNLVGSCVRCNRLKLAAAPTGPHDGFMHPYFDCVKP